MLRCLPSDFLDTCCKQSYIDNSLPTFFVNSTIDHILHYIWNNKLSLNINESTYHDFMESFKHTSRIPNSNLSMQNILSQLSCKLKMNIVLLGLRKNRKTRYPFVKCDHIRTKHCYIPYYKYQNYIYSLFHLNYVTQIVFVEQRKSLFLLTNNTNVTPMLSNLKPCDEIPFEHQIVTKGDIINIIQNNAINLDFTVILFTSYSYVTNCSHKKITQNVVGVYEKKEPAVCIFITPHLNSFNFSLSILPKLRPEHGLNLKNNFSISHLSEGNALPYRNQSMKEEVLNEDYCICQHPDTQFIPVKKLGEFTQLAPKRTQKFLLYENLKSLGLLSSKLQVILKICSEISFIR